jgi:eukaryotic-like serine/threonine-protein kinase
MTEPLATGALLAGLRIVRIIGRGAVGTVYLAVDPVTLQPAALKVVRLDATDGDAQRRLFLQTARTASRLLHADIVAVRDAGTDRSQGWLVMEAVPGGDLERYTRHARLLPEPVVLRVAERIAAALAYAHGQGVVHRDLKPANVLVDWPTDTVKLADFGLARLQDAEQTRTGIVLGSPAYMAPEQLAGAVPTPASDLYALGVVLFQLLAGRLPHDGSSMGELLHQVATETAPDLRALRPALPAALADLVARLLSKRPASRPAGAATVAQALERLRHVLPAPPPPVAAGGPKSRP